MKAVLKLALGICLGLILFCLVLTLVGDQVMTFIITELGS